jgi:hypothetical protein
VSLQGKINAGQILLLIELTEELGGEVKESKGKLRMEGLSEAEREFVFWMLEDLGQKQEKLELALSQPDIDEPFV